MIPKPSDCNGCVLRDGSSEYNLGPSPNGFSHADGMGSIGVAIWVEALGENEELDGLPLRPYAQAGAIMERCIRRASTAELPLDRKMFYIDNIIRCRPPFNKLEGMPWAARAINHCAIHRNRSIADFVARCKSAEHRVKQPVILACGNVPFRELTGIDGKKKTVTYVRGYPFWAGGILVLPTFHPAFVARTRKLIGVLVHDILLAIHYARNGFSKFPINYITEPTHDHKMDLKARVLENPLQLVAFDIETTDIVKGSREWPTFKSIQFALKPGEGYFLDDSDWELIDAILASPNPKAGHNVWRFDNRVLREKYGKTINGRVDDTMWMFHHWEPDLTIEGGKEDQGGAASLSTRAGLQFAASFNGMDFAWKHLNESDPKFYGIADVDAVQRIMYHLPPRMSKYKHGADAKYMSLLDGYNRYVVGLEPIIMKMMKRGVPMDNEARLELHDILVTERKKIDVDLQAAYPDELRNVSPDHGLANEPKEGPKTRRVYLDVD